MEVVSSLVFASLVLILFIARASREIRVLEDQIALERAEKREVLDRLQSIMFPPAFNQVVDSRRDQNAAKREIIEHLDSLEQMFEQSS